MNNTYRYEELAELIENQDFEPVKTWLKNGGDPDLGIDEGKTALVLLVMYELSENGDEKEIIVLMEALLKNGAATNPLPNSYRGKCCLKPWNSEIGRLFDH